jgi:hypothetical protein
MKQSSRILVATGLMAFFLAGCGDDDEATPKPEGTAFEDPSELAYGKSLAEWGGEWWKWIYELPQEQDNCIIPFADATGEDCAYGQDPDADVFFLTGNGGGTVVREQCVAPTGKGVFLPILTYTSDNGGLPPDLQLTEEELHDAVQTWTEGIIVSELVMRVDDQSIEDFEPYYVPATKYTYTLPPEPNTYTCFGGQEKGVVDPSYNGGYYVMLKPLSAGSHTIHFAGRALSTPEDFVLDVTYHLTVE